MKNGYKDIYSYFDSVVLDRLMNLIYADRIYTKPLEFNSKLNKLQLYSEFTINTSMILETERRFKMPHTVSKKHFICHTVWFVYFWNFII